MEKRKVWSQAGEIHPSPWSLTTENCVRAVLTEYALLELLIERHVWAKSGRFVRTGPSPKAYKGGLATS